MDVKQIRRQQSSPARSSPSALKEEEHGDLQSIMAAERKLGSGGTLRNLLVVFACSVLVLAMVVLSGANRSLSLELLRSRTALKEGSSRLCNSEAQNSDSKHDSEAKDPIASFAAVSKDKLLRGLVSPAFDDSTCLSRYQLALYWKDTDHIPSPYLLDRLRRYEDLHKKCAPGTELYNMTIERLRTSNSSASLECNYVIWLPADGLGNRMLSIVAAFLYALLNNRVFLVHFPPDMHGLFCDPFPGASWILPPNVPIENINRFDINTIPQSYGNMIRNKVLVNGMDTRNVSLPAYAFAYLRHDSSDLDGLFYCGESQPLLQKIPWLLLDSNQYFVPALFLVPQYMEELARLFPEKDTVFHHLGRYLFRPTNSVWGYITRYYESYLATAGERVGLQIRTFPHAPIPLDDMLAQVINCTLKNKLLPNINLREPMVQKRKDGIKRKAVLVTNLASGYYEKLRNMYYEHPTVNGELISVLQPSCEEQQRTHQQSHNMKALSEMYLLSFSDVLVTSEWSTFGYVAQGLGGLKSWILVRPGSKISPCLRAMSFDPCFHFPKPLDCKLQRRIDKGTLVPHIGHCEDVGQGLKLFNRSR